MESHALRMHSPFLKEKREKDGDEGSRSTN